jgi:hypothetical protein
VSYKPKSRNIDFAARMQRALGVGVVGAEVRRSSARDRILQAGFWQPPTLRPNAEVVPLFTRRASHDGFQL